MKYFLLLFLGIVSLANTALSQNFDAAVSSSSFANDPIEVGQTSTLAFTLSNLGTDEIPASGLTITISTANNFYETDGVTIPTGSGADLFVWNYNTAADTWFATNSIAISGGFSGQISLNVTGIAPSSSAQATQINLYPPVGDINPSNNNFGTSPPSLDIDPSTGPSANITITESDGSTDVTEGGPTDTYDIVLDAAPTSNVTLTIDPDGEVDLGNGVDASISLIFTPSNWDTPQTVTVTADDDSEVESSPHLSLITTTVSSSDANYNGFSVPDVTVSITDNGNAPFVKICTDPSIQSAVFSPVQIEVGEMAILTANFMNAAFENIPIGSVQISIEIENTFYENDGIMIPGGVGAALFNWQHDPNNTGTDIWVGINNVDIPLLGGGDITVPVTGTAISTGSQVANISLSFIPSNIFKCNNLGNDIQTPGLTINPSSVIPGVTINLNGSVDVMEGGATDSYDVVLDAAPTNDVTLTIDPDDQVDLGNGAGMAITLTFNPSNWDTPQTVTVTADDDQIIEGTHNSMITTTASSVDPSYNNIAVDIVPVSIQDNDGTFAFQPKVFLGGPYNEADMLMGDMLRVQGYVPTQEPYTDLGWRLSGEGGETVTPTAFDAQGADAIVDWVLVEIRSMLDETNILETRAGLLQRDGDIVDTDGTSPLAFNLESANYYVSVRHRNHLGAMTANAVLIASTGTTVDFTNPTTPTWGTNAQEQIGNQMVFRGGNGNNDRRIIHQGATNDINPPFFEVTADPGNVNSLPNYISQGYNIGDYDMNGSTIFQGAGNDINVCFFSVISYPDNIFDSLIFIVSEQIPE